MMLAMGLVIFVYSFRHRFKSRYYSPYVPHWPERVTTALTGLAAVVWGGLPLLGSYYNLYYNPRFIRSIGFYLVTTTLGLHFIVAAALSGTKLHYGTPRTPHWLVRFLIGAVGAVAIVWSIAQMLAGKVFRYS